MRARPRRDVRGAVHLEMRAAVDRLGAVPVDIRPRYTVKDKMRTW